MQTFDFRLIETESGNLINEDLKTPYSSLTTGQVLQYMEMEQILKNQKIVSIVNEENKIGKIKKLIGRILTMLF